MRIQQRVTPSAVTGATPAAPTTEESDDDDVEPLGAHPALEAVRGAHGPAEKALHALLLGAGAPAAELAKDRGSFGPHTETWAKQFQLAVGISPADGQVNEATVAALVSSSEGGQPVFVTRDKDGHRTTFGGMLAHFPKGSAPDGFVARSQNANPRVPLGDQDKLGSNLQDQGCTVTCLAMVATKLLAHDVTPTHINDDKANFTSGSANLNLNAAIDRLGLSSASMEMNEPGAVGELLKAVDAQEPIIMRVDFRGDEKGDHSVVVTGRTGNTLRGIDPATGGPVEMRIEADGEICGQGWRRYQATGFRIVTATGVDVGDLP